MSVLNTKGFICGPTETVESFTKRCEFFKESTKTKQLLKNKMGISQITEHGVLQYDDLDLAMDWVLLNPSKKGLPIWEAAATWTIEIEDMAIPFLQIKSDTKVLKEDVLKHEAVHIARSSFKEPIYEEFLAYATSKSKWRRFLGPLFRTSKESWIFVLLSLCPLLNVFSSFSIELLLTPLIVFSLILMGRLVYYYRIFKKALSNIKKLFDEDFPLSVALRLSDKEIYLFAHSKSMEVYQYIENQNCFRWKQILLSYRLK